MNDTLNTLQTLSFQKNTRLVFPWCYSDLLSIKTQRQHQCFCGYLCICFYLFFRNSRPFVLSLANSWCVQFPWSCLVLLCLVCPCVLSVLRWIIVSGETSPGLPFFFLHAGCLRRNNGELDSGILVEDKCNTGECNNIKFGFSTPPLPGCLS